MLIFPDKHKNKCFKGGPLVYPLFQTDYELRSIFLTVINYGYHRLRIDFTDNRLGFCKLIYMEKCSNGVGASCITAASKQLRCLMRRKRIDSPEGASGHVQLARRLSVFDLVAIGALVSQFQDLGNF